VGRSQESGKVVDVDWRPTWNRGSKLIWRFDDGRQPLTPGVYTVEIVVDIAAASDPMASEATPIRTNHTLSTTIPDPATTQPAPTP
jgi:hypothetical protein